MAQRTVTLDHAQIAALRHRLQTVMQKFVGIVRSSARLEKARTAVEILRNEVRTPFERCPLADDTLELRNMIEVASLIIECARMRKESRGLHFTTDYPQALDSERHDTLVQRRPDEPFASV